MKGELSMKMILGSRGEGKTTELVKLSHKENKPIVCRYKSQIAHIELIAKELNLAIPYPVTVQQIKDGSLQGEKIDGLLIDDAEWILSELIGFNISCIASTPSHVKQIYHRT